MHMGRVDKIIIALKGEFDEAMYVHCQQIAG